MGYDMSLVSPTPEMQEEAEASRKRFDAAVKARDEFEWNAVRTRFPDLQVPTTQKSMPPDDDHKYQWQLEEGWLSIFDVPEINYLAMRNGNFRAAWQALIGSEPVESSFKDLLKRQDHTPPGDPEVRAEYERLQQQVEDDYPVDPGYFRLNIWGMSEYRQVMDSIGMLNYESPPPWPDRDDFNIPKRTGRYDYGAQAWVDMAPGEVGPDGTVAYDDYDEDSPEHHKYEEAREAVVGFPSTEPGIPAVKFSSNDGWHVLPEECQSALDIWNTYATDRKQVIRQWADADEEERKAFLKGGQLLLEGSTQVDGEQRQVAVLEKYEPDPKSYWDRWLAFLERGVACDGFQVW